MLGRLAVTALILVLAVANLGGCAGSNKGLDMSSLGLGSELSSILGQVTGLLGGITGLGGASDVLPQLTGLDADLGSLVSKAADATPQQREQLSKVASESLPGLQSAIGNVVKIPGVSDVLSPTLDSIVGKVSGLI